MFFNWGGGDDTPHGVFDYIGNYIGIYLDMDFRTVPVKVISSNINIIIYSSQNLN